MNLDEFRQAYYRAETFGNTPKKLYKRASNFLKSITGIFKGAKKDYRTLKRRKSNRKKAYEEFKNPNARKRDKVKAAGKVLKNSPIMMNSKTRQAMSQTVQSSLNLGKSLNELGSTAASIVGGNRNNNLYDGQDLEKGNQFLLQALSYIHKGIQLPSTASRKATHLIKDVGHATKTISALIPEQAKEKIKEISKNAVKTAKKLIEEIFDR